MSGATGRVNSQSWTLGPELESVQRRQVDWQRATVGARFWGRDASLWPAATPQDVASRMGWLELPTLMRSELPKLLAFTEEVRSNGFRYVVVLGMGGSSLAPDVFRRMFGHRAGYPELRVLDSTHPAAVANLEGEIDLARSLFLVSSKSGTTTEPLSFHRYFSERLRAAGDAAPGRHFVAITDPGTPLQSLAEQQGFRATFLALSTVGGRYSALTMFGLVPAALAGVDLPRLLEEASRMSEACSAKVQVADNPGLSLGAVLGELDVKGRNKLTIYATPGFAPYPDWVEQLVAESTGKIGKGIVPVVDEPFVDPEHYGADRLFVAFLGGGVQDGPLTAHLVRLESAGHPIIRIQVGDLVTLGQEFFRWEVGVASSAMIMGIDPYDQPDVELAKNLARQAMSKTSGESVDSGAPPILSQDARTISASLLPWLDSSRRGDYFTIQAYLPPSVETTTELAAIRLGVLERRDIATTVGYGPRFLHSTGQLHKGGPNTGLFLQIFDRPSKDLPVPGAGYTFAEIIHAQALGDYQALVQKGRRVLRVDLETDVPGGLRRIREALDA